MKILFNMFILLTVWNANISMFHPKHISLKDNILSICWSVYVIIRLPTCMLSKHSPPHKLKYKKWRPKKNSSAVGPHEVHWCQVCWLEKNWLGRFWEKQFFSFLGSSENFFGPPKPYLASETPTLGGSYF